MEHVVADVETDGLLAEATVIHSLVLRDLYTDQVLSCADQPGYPPIEEGLTLLTTAKRVYFHNAVNFDYPVLRKLRPGWDMDPQNVMDTLVIARVVFAHIKETDWNRVRKGRLPGYLVGRHSLKAWGHRLGVYKDDYTGGFEQWSEELQLYCEQDTATTRALVNRLRARGFSRQAIRMELDLAWYLASQQRNGFPFNVEAAQKLQIDLAGKREAVKVRLKEQFGRWYVQGRTFTPKSNNKRWHYVKGAPVSLIKVITFNPGSRDQIAARLIQKYGWKPTEFTPGGRPEINEGTLKGLDFPEVKDLRRYLLLDKRLGQLSEGQKAWLRYVKVGEDGVPRIHGSINPNGTVTHRGSHSHPNIGQVPKVGKPFGKECRSLFTVPPGWVQLGADAEGLELRMLGHFMARWDDGAYVKVLLEADVHDAAMVLLGLDNRDTTKTFEYAYLYGSGDLNLGSIIDPGASEDKQRKIGKRLRARLEKGLPALGYLNEAVRKKGKKGWLRGIDGRAVFIRHQHAALNTLLQCAGSLVVKYWIVSFSQELTRRFGPQCWNGQWVALAWIHDEVQLAVRPEIAEEVSQVVVAAMPPVGELFKMNCPLSASVKLGKNWAETH